MQLWIASSNKNKIREISNMLADLKIEVKSTVDLPVYSPPPETGTTFEQNAKIKAKSLKAMKPDAWIIADDSGIECEGLNNLPGVHSARYAGENASDAENTAKLIKMIKIRTANRKARMICCLAVISPDAQEYVFQGVLNGSIAQSQKGSGGFGYDPVFIPDGMTKTMAELEPGEKNKISHRSVALREFKEFLKTHL